MTKGVFVNMERSRNSLLTRKYCVFGMFKQRNKKYDGIRRDPFKIHVMKLQIKWTAEDALMLWVKVRHASERITSGNLILQIKRRLRMEDFIELDIVILVDSNFITITISKNSDNKQARAQIFQKIITISRLSLYRISLYRALTVTLQYTG
ncbi:hypothetical protein PHYBLDRAFT_171532 [Phycomyces blakesleeanus NRRL 1555(-)]|uniref:Uncharacterized protein n=1 Tax=Phycomyces blakesleeanus (strain ATCC 8743b / DSM 1359 / FGSC 10004 / NBRC 33097 / NRRL 1555) TaxID=763407 RepID=A0A162PLV2_PHYB8|nr:hypothetical protein PHYBLDRAFT_171532 [Phycomyces blakesleeanus NRRL 1555(-)]OAD70146.1 hypothetical protein PHYBLDRAFT_171532 [Phycomyces blakesleeanus NRRL 1555(-)]|eukprot:XP_018288186.1 hypothetical protein PHYBLDRAFT_171532 [Phycomyces blakesleeanus NRRL 1555(-)]